MKHLDKLIQDALINNNVLTASQLRVYQDKADKTGIFLRETLLAEDVVNEKQILIALSQNYQLKTVEFKTLAVPQDVIDRVPVKFAWYYKFIPVKIENDRLIIASAFPFSVKIQDEIRMHIGLDLEVVLCQESELNEAFKKYYGLASDTIDRIMSKAPKVTGTALEEERWVEDLERKSDDPTVSNLVNEIILEAFKKRATDIHIEPYRDRVRFRYRIDGVLVDANLPPNVKHFLPQILSRIKILANLSITERRLPQDGSAVVKTKEQQLDLRVSTMPTPRGESMVLRILPTKVILLSLEKLGFDPHSVQLFRQLIDQPHGIIFITGPTGSGKTTTLYACLNEINSSERKIITIEDPVEYEMEGITQVQVNPKVDFSFAKGLRSILRHDPDILMVGEVRDPETAEIAIKTALTGHLVFSTLHTNDSASAITRLIDMGVEPYLVASSVEAFIAQRLIRVICPKCKQEDPQVIPGLKEDIVKSLNILNPNEITFYKGKGCDFCNQTGYYGRLAIYEILTLNDRIKAAILEKPRSDYIKKIARQNGLITLRQNGWKAVLNGVTTPDEVLHVTVKDDVLEKETPVVKTTAEKLGDPYTLLSKVQDSRLQRLKKRGEWATNNEYDSRAHPRSFVPHNVSYKLVKRDETDPNFLVTDGIEHSAITQDMSAGGLRFHSKTLVPVGSLLEVKIPLQGAQKTIECLAKVCRVDENELKNLYSTVSCFLDIAAADKNALQSYLEQELQKNSSIETKL